MIYKQRSQKPDHVSVLFELPAGLWADRIYLTGDFNDWSASATPFTQGVDGRWRVAIDLPVDSRHAFCYLIDGLWHSEYSADGWTQALNGMPISLVEATLPALSRDNDYHTNQPTRQPTGKRRLN
ncbi:MAG: hypothetical protein DYG89_32170 [Caldilinea sp. CFX5]|nr:hypothetical protein [Caldilinea sp. CFX5]